MTWCAFVVVFGAAITIHAESPAAPAAPDGAEKVADLHDHVLKNPDGSWKYTNALIGQTSPYLLQHAHNPVDWMPWGPEAFDLAKREQKPVFLSVGYSTCYWCHVMEREVFENPELAKMLNERFVCIKLDREERPDVDQVYMTATQVMTRQGGWPNNVFLTPPAPDRPGGADAEDADAIAGYGLKPFYCVTYLPPEPSRGLPGFGQVATAMHHAWENDRATVLEQARRLGDAVVQVMADTDTPGPVTLETPRAAVAALQRIYDAEHAGFGGAPKFPSPSNLVLLLAAYRHADKEQQDALLEPVLHTLDRMARGGIYDQVGGGFHRYSTDAQWLIPHFEKMLYDNGQLLSVYADALVVLRQRGEGDSARAALFERVLRETAEYLLREMRDDTDAFWSAQDAEVDAREGLSYLWTRAQVEVAIEDEERAALAVRMYGLDRGTNFQDPHAPHAPPANVLYLPVSLDALAEQFAMSRAALRAQRERINHELKAARDRREQPGTDDKVLASWNGLTIKGLADAGAIMDEPRYLAAARDAADAIIEHMSDDEGTLLHSMRLGRAHVPGFLDDYTHLAAGFLALAQSESREDRDLEQAQRLTRLAIERFAAEGGGYYDTLPDQADLFVRVRSAHDGAVPTGNSMMVQNLVDLYRLTGDAAWLDRAVLDLRGFADWLGDRHLGLAGMQAAAFDAWGFEEVHAQLAAPANAPSVEPDAPVQVSAAWTSDGKLVLSLEIKEGVHLNAHEVNEKMLIPTTVELVGPGRLAADYPEGEQAHYAYADRPIRVYEGTVIIRVELDGWTPDSAIRLRYQACTDTYCMQPAEVRIAIPARP